MIGIMFLIFAICMILAIPVGFSIAISATAFLFFDAGIPIFSIVQKMVDGINSFSYLALPLFVLSGAIMVYGATPRLMRFANMLLGRLPGGIGRCRMPRMRIFRRHFRLRRCHHRIHRRHCGPRNGPPGL